VTVGAAACGNCHGDTVNATTGSAPENVLPSFYPQALGGAGLDPCDGSEENFASNSISLDNDGDGLTDSADPDCAGNAAPVADPNGPYSADVGVNVSFDGSGSTDDGTIVEYQWDFGDGTALGMGVTPTHTYGAAGTYTVTLTVTDDGGLTDTGTTTAIITDVPPPNQAPTADPNGPYNAQVGDAINFSGAGSSDPDGTIVAYDWDFGDGSTGTGANPMHAYGAAGTFTVTLTVTDDGGLTDAGTTTATITDAPPPNQAPTANANGPYNAQVGDTINFSGAGSSDPDGTIVAYDWDFGDGSTGTGANPTHAYGAAGTFTVTLTVTDDGSPALTGTAITTATITDAPPPNQAPTADPNGPYSAQVGDTINFNGSGSSDPDGALVAYDWDFGDGSTGTGANPTHTYGAAGTFTVTLTVTDDGSPALTGTAITTATITDAPPPNQAPTADPNGPYNAQVGDPVTFDGSASSDPDGTIVTHAWDFGDGNTGTGANPTHTYGVAGTYTVTLTVTDDGGLTGTGTTTATVTEVPPVNQLPIADPGGPYNGFVNEAIAFDGSGSTDPDGGAIQSWDWDFGDGSTGAGESPTHIYVANGTYAVQLTVTDDEGQTSAVAMTNAVVESRPANQAPVADAGGPYSDSVGRTITFDGSGSSDAEDPNTGLTFAWDFGDGATGTGQSPSNSYSVAGTYTVTLTVTDSGGLSGTATTTATIEDLPTDGDGETLYNAWCLGCHGDFDQPNQASSIKVLGARSCSIDASIDGNPVAGTNTPYPDGVPDMQFMQGVLSGPNVDAISGWMNGSPVSAAERYTTACSGCHGADGSGGFVAGDIRGKGGNVGQAISNVDAMKFLSCLPESEIIAFGDFLGREEGQRTSSGGSGSTGPMFLMLFAWTVYLTRRRRMAG
jgi:PKD repeat protein